MFHLIRRRAAAGQQYAIVVGLIGVIAILAVTQMGGGVKSLMTNTGNTLTNVVNGTVGSGGTGSGGAGGGGGGGGGGTGTLIAVTSTDFGNLGIGASRTLDFTYTVNAGGAVTGVSAQVTGSGLSLTANSCGTAGSPLASLAANASCTLTVSWTPSGAGALSGSVAVTSSSGTSSQSLSGSGLPTIGGTCVRDGSDQVWCLGTSTAATGISTCGHPGGYSGRYFAATPQAAAAHGKGFSANQDCATNYTNTPNTVINSGSLSCWNDSQRWARPGTDSSSLVVVRCVNQEGSGVGFGPDSTSNYGNVSLNVTASLTFTYSALGSTSVSNVSASASGPGITLGSNSCGTSGSPVSSLSNGSSCSVTVNWQSSVLGALSGASVSVTSSAGTRTINLSGNRVNLPANCARDSNNQVWCIGTSIPATGISTCGHPGGYSGPYYAATAAAATALGKGLSPNVDCATNYMNGPGTTINGASLGCWNDSMRWARSGNDSGTPVVVRCTNME